MLLRILRHFGLEVELFILLWVLERELEAFASVSSGFL